MTGLAVDYRLLLASLSLVSLFRIGDGGGQIASVVPIIVALLTRDLFVSSDQWEASIMLEECDLVEGSLLPVTSRAVGSLAFVRILMARLAVLVQPEKTVLPLGEDRHLRALVALRAREFGVAAHEPEVELLMLVAISVLPSTLPESAIADDVGIGIQVFDMAVTAVLA